MRENNYEFRARIDIVHPGNLRDHAQKPEPEETVVTGEWKIVTGDPDFSRPAAEDLREFLFRSMEIDIAAGQENSAGEIRLEAFPSGKMFEWEVGPERTVIRGNLRRGVHWLEERMT